MPCNNDEYDDVFGDVSMSYRNGRPPSPWTTLDKSKDISVLENANSANLVSNMNSLMRSGGGLGAGAGSLKMKVGGDKLKLKPNASPTKTSTWNKSNSY